MKQLISLVEEEVNKRKALETEKQTIEKKLNIIKDVILTDENTIDNQTREKVKTLFNDGTYEQIESENGLPAARDSLVSLCPSDFDDTMDRFSYRGKKRSMEKSGRCSLQKKKKFEGKVHFQLGNEEGMEIDKIYEEIESPKSSTCDESNLISSLEPPSPAPQSVAELMKTPYNLRRRSSNTCLTSTPYQRYSSYGKLTHAFVSRSVLRSEKCYICDKAITFCKPVQKCRDCKMACHPECMNQSPLPCIPVTPTPIKGSMSTISDYTSTSSSPMVPSLVVHCVNEIEARGLKETGLYRKSGIEGDVKELKEKLLKGKHLLNLNRVNIHTLCGTIKEFLRSLKEPLIPRSAWQNFVEAADLNDDNVSVDLIHKAVCRLSQPNKETLAFLMLHLQRVAESPDCQMPLDNLAKVLGPTVVGYSVEDPSDSKVLKETTQQCQVMKKLLLLPDSTWQNLLNTESPDDSGLESKTDDAMSEPAKSRLGPIYATVQKPKSSQVKKKNLMPRLVKLSC
ncbi:rac GTPase-activating protein 1 [Caerostris extrusa]|uniref:Rac GTPase-activating protein 1 n=1 Tax=Caerostris extrusa TaxID=172846 RepID=A0AAV4X5Y2_CAEEX|nr:rac GTPase-activating protein 1 [Caerostris extrusa]